MITAVYSEGGTLLLGGWVPRLGNILGRCVFSKSSFCVCFLFCNLGFRVFVQSILKYMIFPYSSVGKSEFDPNQEMMLIPNFVGFIASIITINKRVFVLFLFLLPKVFMWWKNITQIDPQNLQITAQLIGIKRTVYI